MSDLRRSPLDDRHRALGAKMADFGGWQMPIEYPGGGVIKEHTAVREAVGVFDVSHLGKATVRGPGAADFVNRTLTNDLGRVAPGGAQYTMCCDEETGGVADDLIAYVHGGDDVFLVPNAANTAEVVRRLAAAAPGGVRVHDRHGEYGVLAVQGPRSADLLTGIGLPAGGPYMGFAGASWRGEPLVVCRTGYTGEHGYELLPAWDATGTLWDALLDAGRALGGRPCGLGARDTLRTEMGYPLHGHELSMQITPVQARSGWAVGWRKQQFWGRAPLIAEKASGPARLLWGLESLDRGIPRPHMVVRSAAGDRLGEVTSGTFSPTRRIGIGLALLGPAAGVAEGDEVSVDVRGRPTRARVVRPPFVASSVR
jgi:aminomethyltransferase